MVLIKKSKKAY